MAVGAERLSMVIRNTRQLSMQKIESRLARRCAVLSVDFLVLRARFENFIEQLDFSP
jgi:hypothetical protein